MKVGFRTAGFAGHRTGEILRTLKDAGYDGVELCFEHDDLRPEHISDDACADVQALADEVGIAIASLSYHADNEEPTRRTENIERILALAPQFRTNVLILNSRRTEPGRRREQWDEFVRQLRRYAERVEAHSLRLAIEPEPGMFVESSAEALRLIAEVGSPSIAVNLDIGHAAITDPDLPAAIRELGRHIAHTHIEDIADRVHKHLVPGDGDLDFAAIWQAFADIGYEGYYTIDLFAIHDDPAGWARRARAGLRAVCQRHE